MNYQMNGSKSLNGIKRSMAFILMLAMVITSLGIAGWGTDQVHAAEGDGTATVRIVGPDNQFVITEASINIVSGVTTLGAVVAEACSNHGIGILELSTGEYGGWPSTIGGIDIDGSFWMNTLNDSSPDNNYIVQTAKPGDRIVLYPYSVGNYSQFTILTHSAVTTSGGFGGNTTLTGILTLKLQTKNWRDLSDSEETPLSLDVKNSDSISEAQVDVDYNITDEYGNDLKTSRTGNLEIQLHGICSTPAINGYEKIFIVTSTKSGIVKPYLRILMTPGGFSFTQPVGLGSYRLDDPVVKHSEDVKASVAAIISGIFENKDTYSADYYDNDWALGLFAAGLTPTAVEHTNYLVWVLDQVVKENFSVASKAKTAIALATIGVDARSIPNRNTGSNINILEEVIGSEVEKLSGTYALPFLLSLIDLEPYKNMTDAAITRGKIIERILSSESENDGWGSSDEGTGFVLPALAPYNKQSTTVNGISVASCNAITAIVGSAVTRLAKNMGEYGGYINGGKFDANTQAVILTGLHALNINTHENDFLNSASGMDNLLSYATTDNRLKKESTGSFDPMASKQGAWALATYQNLNTSYPRSSNLYHFTPPSISVEENWPEEGLLTSIQVLQPKNIYDINATVNPGDLTVQAIYSGDPLTATNVAINATNITHEAFTTAGNFTVTVNYKGLEVSYVISVAAGEGTVLPEVIYKSISASIRDGNKTIASNRNLMIEDGKTSALDALRSLTAETGVNLEENRGYVSAINGLREFDRGENSGWLYRVNGTTPTTTASKDYKLKNGDILEWYYSQDYKKDPSSSAWVKEEEKISELVAKEDGKGSATVEVSKADMDKLIKDGSSLKAKSSVATIEMDADTLKGLGNEMGKDLEITVKKIEISNQEGITQEMKDKIGDRPVLDLTVMSGNKQISSFDGKVTVSIPYTLKKGEDPNAVVIYLIKDNGEFEIVRNCEFDPLTSEVKFTTSHFSLFGIGYKELGFKDIDGHWAKEYITYLAARDYITGMSKDSFSPNGTLTRGQFVQLLANLAGADLDKYGSALLSSINDVKASDWFAPAVAWAVEQGVVTGVKLPDGTTSFYPEKSISRQDIAVMLNRYRDNIDKKAFPETVKEKTFQDNNQISDYAKDSVKALQKTGIIQGKTDTTFAPLDQAKRGEAAKMIHGMLKLN